MIWQNRSKKAIFEFDHETKEMYLAEIHPRIKLEDIKKDIPWDLKVSQNLSQTKRPSDEEIDFIRNFAPAAVMGRTLSTEAALANLAGDLDKRGKI